MTPFLGHRDSRYALTNPVQPKKEEVAVQTDPPTKEPPRKNRNLTLLRADRWLHPLRETKSAPSPSALLAGQLMPALKLKASGAQPLLALWARGIAGAQQPGLCQRGIIDVLPTGRDHIRNYLPLYVNDVFQFFRLVGVMI